MCLFFCFPNSVCQVLARTYRKRWRRLRATKRNWRTTLAILFHSTKQESILSRLPHQELKWVCFSYALASFITEAQSWICSSRPLTFSLNFPYVCVFLLRIWSAKPWNTSVLIRSSTFRSKCRRWSIQRCALTVGSVTWPVTTLDIRCICPHKPWANGLRLLNYSCWTLQSSNTSDSRVITQKITCPAHRSYSSSFPL